MRTTVRERCDGARVRPNPSCPLPLGHCWDGQTHLAPVSLKLQRLQLDPTSTSVCSVPSEALAATRVRPGPGGGACMHWQRCPE